MCCYFSSYDSVPSRQCRPSKVGFRMNHARFFCSRLQVRLLKVVRFMVRRFEFVKKRLASTSTSKSRGGSDRRCSRSSSGKRLVLEEDCLYQSHEDYRYSYSSSSSYKMSKYGQSPFHAEAIADCLEFIKRSSGPLTITED